MIIYIGSDHRGYEMKTKLYSFLKNKGYEVADVGPENYVEDDDYPDYAEKVAVNVSLEYENAKGVLLCGSGVGVDIVANKFERIRCALAFNPDQAYDSRNDDDSNIIALPSNYLTQDEAQKILFTWLETPFSNEPRHKRRLDKIYKIEERACKDIKQSNF